jgi:hypothetical protein
MINLRVMNATEKKEVRKCSPFFIRHFFAKTGTIGHCGFNVSNLTYENSVFSHKGSCAPGIGAPVSRLEV